MPQMQKALLSSAQYQPEAFSWVGVLLLRLQYSTDSHRRAATLVTDQIAGVQFLDRPGRREAAGAHCDCRRRNCRSRFLRSLWRRTLSHIAPRTHIPRTHRRRTPTKNPTITPIASADSRQSFARLLPQFALDFPPRIANAFHGPLYPFLALSSLFGFVSDFIVLTARNASAIL
jgi:hypothetical protein